MKVVKVKGRNEVYLGIAIFSEYYFCVEF